MTAVLAAAVVLTLQPLAAMDFDAKVLVLLLAIAGLPALSCRQAAPAAPLGPEALVLSDPSWVDYERWYRSAPREMDIAEAVPAYLTSLSASGMAPSEAGHRAADLRRDLLELTRLRWNRVLTAKRPHFNWEPNAFLVKVAAELRPGRALDCGMGQGRNALYLARQGWEVTGFDLADEAVADANAQAARLGLKIHGTVEDSDHFAFGESKWDLAVATYFPLQGVAQRLKDSIKPGGALLIEAFAKSEADQHRVSSNTAYDVGELKGLFSGFQIVELEESLAVPDFGNGEPVRIVRLFARRPAAGEQN